MLDVAFTIDRRAAEPVYRQLALHIQQLIDSRRLTPGVKLPPSRTLADSLGLNRNTINHAYQSLLSEGYLTARVGQGTFVADRLNPVRVSPARRACSARRASVDWDRLFSSRASAIFPPLRARVDKPIRYDFLGGNVAPDHLPVRKLRHGVLKAIDYRLARIANEKDPFGWQPMRERIARYLLNRGLQCDAKEVAVINGAQQALDLGEGLRTDQRASLLRRQRVKLIYTTPAAQSPTCIVISERRRRELLELVEQHDVAVFEDDYDSELRYGGPPVPALHAQDTSGRVIHAGTFGKVIMPGLRIGYVVADRRFLSRLVVDRWNTDVETNVLMQVAMADMLENGGLERHIRRVYAERLGAMVNAFETHLPVATTWITPGGGHGIWLTWPEAIEAERGYRSALDAGVAYTPADLFYRSDAPTQHAAVAFSAHGPEEIAEGIHILGTVARRASPRKGTRR